MLAEYPRSVTILSPNHFPHVTWRGGVLRERHPMKSRVTKRSIRIHNIESWEVSCLTALTLAVCIRKVRTIGNLRTLCAASACEGPLTKQPP
jgi:hypothetical protein